MILKLDLSIPEKTALAGEMFALFHNGSRNSFSVPALSRELHQLYNRKSGVGDPYKEVKKQSNDQVLRMYAVFKEQIAEAADPFDTALRLAVAGNIIDYGVSDHFNLEETLQKVLNSDFAIDHVAQLKQKIKEAETVLYLCDNAGEIVFDKLFIETMNHPNLWYAVRGAPVINDATIEDTRYVHMDEVAHIIENGYDAPSTILDHCSAAFQDLFEKADLVISKGQGNLEGLIDEGKKGIFFLLMVKCGVIADVLGVKKGEFVCYEKNMI